MGTPKIEGGMTYAEQQKLLADERTFQQQEEDKRRAQMLEDEQRREQAAEAERNRLAAEEAKRLAEINQAEEAVIEEDEEAKKKKKSDLSKVSFYDALGKGVVNAATAEKPK
jgi:hypothetical protein